MSSVDHPLRLGRATVLGLLAPVVSDAAHALSLPRRLTGTDGIVLSFDDGPHPEGTPAVLDMLAEAGLTAMFFLIGEQVERRPDLAARIHGGGHLVALHGYRHRLQLRMRASELAADLERGVGAIEDAVGIRPTWHRPPYGIYSPAGLAAAQGRALKHLLWSRWGKDWRKFTTPERIAARATRDLCAGDVILLHDADFYSSRHSHRRTLAALPLLISELNRRGLDTVLPV